MPVLLLALLFALILFSGCTWGQQAAGNAQNYALKAGDIQSAGVISEFGPRWAPGINGERTFIRASAYNIQFQLPSSRLGNWVYSYPSEDDAKADYSDNLATENLTALGQVSGLGQASRYFIYSNGSSVHVIFRRGRVIEFLQLNATSPGGIAELSDALSYARIADKRIP